VLCSPSRAAPVLSEGRFDRNNVQKVTLNGPVGDLVIAGWQTNVHTASREPSEIPVADGVCLPIGEADAVRLEGAAVENVVKLLVAHR
jgi:hypothetical protein